jgi:hypothetical protein
MATIDGRPISFLIDTGTTFFLPYWSSGDLPSLFYLHSQGGGNSYPALNDLSFNLHIGRYTFYSLFPNPP